MYIETIEQLISPILLEDFDKIEIREIIDSNEKDAEIVILAPNEICKRLIGKNGITVQALTTLINVKAEANNHKVKIKIAKL